MCKRLLTLCFLTALSVSSSVLLAGVAQAGPQPVCGDGTQEGTEECDDSNTVSGDGCDADCRDEVCGNGGEPQSTTTPPEECDDGNTIDDDGCTDTCQFDCGDGEIDAGTTPPETCEDNNATNGDGCDDDTTSDPPGNCTATDCGNGVVTTGEACDDGNTVSGDGCEADCTVADNPQLPKQQACINAVNKNLAGVLKARNTDNNTCYKATAAGKQADFLACFGDDLKGKVAGAGNKTTNTIGKKCNDAEEVPDFAFTDAATVNGAANTESNDAFLFVFGATPTIVLKSADKAAAACQASAVSLLNKQTDTVIKEANKAKKTALKGGKGGTPPPAAGAGALGDAIDTALTGNGKILAAAGKIATTLGKKCTDGIIDANFDCGGAATSVATLATCIELSAFQAACEALEAGDNIDLTCVPVP